MIVKYAVEEMYPVYLPAEDSEFRPADTMELPDDLAERFLRVTDEFWSVQREIKAFLKAVHRDEHADDRLRAINQARLERGRKRHYRRTRPSSEIQPLKEETTDA